MSKPLRLILVMVVIGAGCLALRSCNQDAEYKALEKSYQQALAVAKMDHDLYNKDRDQANADIAARDAKIKSLEDSAAVDQSQIATGNQALQTLQQLEPTIKDKDALILNLHGQVSELTNMFSLSQKTVAEQTQVIDQLKIKFADQVKISDDWQKDYNQEHALRLTAESLVKKLQSMTFKPSLKTTAVHLVVSMAAGIVCSKLIK